MGAFAPGSGRSRGSAARAWRFDAVLARQDGPSFEAVPLRRLPGPVLAETQRAGVAVRRDTAARLALHSPATLAGAVARFRHSARGHRSLSMTTCCGRASPLASPAPAPPTSPH